MLEALDVDARVVVLGIVRMTEATASAILIITLPLYLSSGILGGSTFGLTPAFLAGIVLSVAGLIQSFGQPVTGRLSDLVRRRRPFVVAGLGIKALAAVGYAFAPTYLAVVLLRLLDGSGGSLTIPTTLALVNEYAEETATGTAGNMGIYTAFRMIGLVVGPFVGGVILDLGPYRLLAAGSAIHLSGFEAAFLAAAGGVAASFVLVALVVYDAAETTPIDRDRLAINVFASDPGRVFDPVFVGGLTALVFGITISMISAIQPTINARLGQGSTAFAAQYAGLIVVIVVFSNPVGRLSDRYGRRPFIVTPWLLLVPATLVQGYVTTPTGMLFARLLQGFATALAFAPAVAMVGEFAAQRASGASTQLATLMMFVGLGTATGPLVSGYLIRFGYATPFAAAAALATVAGLLVYTQIPETHEGIVSGEIDPIGRRLWTALLAGRR